ncbi:ABC transporter permease [Gemmiger sp. An50]|uniref:ABC transporter permease n=1 Tax=Gemmiger sp. An50 TaxID=1965639 RepID=UPI000B3A6A4F|nr:ABC transporter permease [Gemmiger sp. An50]OUN86910.1 ABC transporter permease [Gemmiger sp. An50]
MSIMLLQGAVEQGFIYALVALALYLSYRTLDIADLTTDGTFVLGCAVSASLCSLGQPVLGLVGGFGAGLLAGFVTAFLHTRLKIQAILAGIITMTGLYTVNLWVMGGRADLPLLKVDTIFTYTQSLLGESYGKLITVALITCVVGVLLALFLKTQLGLSIRATGDNRDMVSASSIDPSFTITVGLCLANGLTALAGGVLAQYQMSSNLSLGTGVVVIGLASLIIGEVVVRRGGVGRCIAGAIVGSVIYRVLMVFALRASANPANLKLISAVIVAVAIGWPALVDRLRLEKRKAAAKQKGGR